jgi:hypothetical protein
LNFCPQPLGRTILCTIYAFSIYFVLTGEARILPLMRSGTTDFTTSIGMHQLFSELIMRTICAVARNLVRASGADSASE